MPTFIKTGFWEKVAKGYKGWLNLDDLISSIASTSSTSSNFPTVQKETEVFNDVTLAGINISETTNIYSTSLLFPNLTNVTNSININPNNSDSFQLLDFPNLETVDTVSIRVFSLIVLNVPKLSFVKNLYIASCNDIVTINLFNLTTITEGFFITSLDSLTTLNTSSLESVQGDIIITRCPNLNTINLPNLTTFSPPSQESFDVSENGLTETCINALLAKLVELAGSNTGLGWDISMQGGTNAAPSGQGILDVATLESKGCTVTTN